MNKDRTRAQIILHPLRAQILAALGGQPLTPRQIAAQMEQVPLGTVYRHLNTLLEAGLIEVVRERRIKGTVERQFALVEAATFLTDDDRQRLTPDDITGLVSALSGVVQSAFYRYTRQAEMPPKAGEIALVAKPLYLTREEYAAFREQLIALLAKWDRPPGPEFERRMVAFFSVPDPALPAPDESKGNTDV